MPALDKLIQTIVKVLVFVGGLFLVAMICLTCANIFFRIIWFPIRGTFEFMGYFGAIVTAFALAYTEMNRGHIAVDVMVNRFPKKIQKVLYIVNSLVCFVFFAIATVYIFQKATILLRTGEVTETLQIIYYPFTYAVALGFGILSLVMLSNTIKTLFPGEENPN
jgi:TRAP-type C4-dicarboxylate transport system permease small subunit